MMRKNDKFEGCHYQKCLHCPHKECWTGQVAREQGKKGYKEFMKMLDESVVVEN